MGRTKYACRGVPRMARINVTAPVLASVRSSPVCWIRKVIGHGGRSATRRTADGDVRQTASAAGSETPARTQGILCQGRGSAANSAVCYCLGITEVDPARIEVLFERFISKERHEPPDIDVDFEHERREAVIQYLYGKYGRERAALTATVITYRPKSAIRDVGKALGLGLDEVERLAKNVYWWDGKSIIPRLGGLSEIGLDPENPVIARLMRLVREIVGFPRHLSQHVGGFVISRGPLSRLVPIENAAMEGRTVIEWDKTDLDALGLWTFLHPT